MNAPPKPIKNYRKSMEHRFDYLLRNVLAEITIKEAAKSNIDLLEKKLNLDRMNFPGDT